MKIELKADGFIAGTELSQFAECCAAFEPGRIRADPPG